MNNRRSAPPLLFDGGTRGSTSRAFAPPAADEEATADRAEDARGDQAFDVLHLAEPLTTFSKHNFAASSAVDTTHRRRHRSSPPAELM